MELFLQVLAALLIVAGLLGLGWLLFGKLVAPVGAEGRVFAVVPAAGDAETLEHDIQGLLWLRGGDLAIRWDEADGHVYMTGPAVTVFEGELL